MFDLAKKSALAAALVATALSSASPAYAHDRRDHGGDDVTGAVVLGVLGVAAVAVLASSAKHHDRCDGDRDDPDRCYRGYNDGYYQQQGYNGGYYRQGGYDNADGYYRNGDEGRHRGHRQHDRDDEDSGGEDGYYYGN